MIRSYAFVNILYQERYFEGEIWFSSRLSHRTCLSQQVNINRYFLARNKKSQYVAGETKEKAIAL